MALASDGPDLLHSMATAETSLQNDLHVGTLTGSTSAVDLGRRILTLVGGFRILVAAAMVVVALLPISPPFLGARYPLLFLVNGVLYLLAALILGVALRRDAWSLQRVAIVQLAVDLGGITLAVHASGSVTTGLEALLVVFVAAAGLCLPGRGAYFAAAVATLAVLAEQSIAFLQGAGDAVDFLPAGVLGAIMLLIAVAIHPLVRRIEETEALARQRGIDLANLAQLNEYIIQNLRESIVVVDEAEDVRLINQSAAERLGTTVGRSGQSLHDLSPALQQLLHDWRAGGMGEHGEPPSFLASDGSTLINAHFAALGPDQVNGPVLMFLEDASLLAEKVQQSKLAALGRLSASIAHEVRNPVGALSHAGQLLAESPVIGAEEKRFIDIIQTNTRRVSEIVDNILQLSRRDAVNPELLSLERWTRDFAGEFTRTLELFEGQVSVLNGPDDENVEVRMDPGHLHQVVWNLCENAARHASEAAGGIAVELHYGRLPSNRRPFLDIIDHGAGIPEEMRDMVFEPFASGRIGGTGLGLYICRELCERNRATLRYLPGENGGSIFQIVFADPNRWES